MIDLRIDYQIREGEELISCVLTGRNREVLLAELEENLGSSSPVWILLSIEDPHGYGRCVRELPNILSYLKTGDRARLHSHHSPFKRKTPRRRLDGWQVPINQMWKKKEDD